MKKLSLLSVQFCMSLTFSNGQSYLEGNWTGTLLQEDNGKEFATKYDYSMEIKVNGAVIEGRSTIIAGPNFGILHFKGSLKDSVFTFAEDKIIQEDLKENYFWCYKSGSIRIKKRGNQLLMEGPWGGYTIQNGAKSTCSPGTILVKKEVGVISMKGSVVDSISGKQIPAKIKIKNIKTEKIESNLNTNNGQFDIELPGANTYELTITALGYLTKYEYIKLDKSKILNIPLSPIQAGTKVNMKSILFEKSTTKLTTSSFPELDRLYDFLKTNTTVKIELQGHTSDEGPADLNKKLSLDRVVSIQNYLTKKGIPKSRISCRAFGESQPMVPNTTEENRKLNRRVAFEILGK